MAQAKKKWVVFRGSNRIPGHVVGKGHDDAVQVEPGKPIQVSEAYAKHLVEDGFAQYCDPPKKAPAKKAKDTSTPTQTDVDAYKLAEAQKVVDDLTAKIGAMGEDDVERPALSKELEKAQQELAALQPAIA